MSTSSQPVTESQDVLVQLTVRQIHALLPGCLRFEEIVPDDQDVYLPVHLDDVWGQLKRGRVQTRTRDLVVSMPPECLTEFCFAHADDPVSIPLSLLVTAFPGESFTAGAGPVNYGHAVDVPDLFLNGDGSPTSFVSHEEEKAVVREQHVDGVLLFGLDINTASADDFVRRLNGVGPKLAATIVAERDAAGPFEDVQDLQRVKGLGGKLFERITGLKAGNDGGASRRQALHVVRAGTEGVLDLRSVASRFSGLDGFEGCLLVDEDGDVLASSWTDSPHEAIGAFAPQLILKLKPYIQSIDATVDLISIFISDRPFTLIPFGTLVLVAVHEPGRFSRAQLRLAREVASSLDRHLFS